MDEGITLGDFVKDVVTGFSGVVTGDCVYLSGCKQFLVQPSVDEKEAYRDGRWIDIDRLEIVGKERIVLKNRQTDGFDIAPPIK